LVLEVPALSFLKIFADGHRSSSSPRVMCESLRPSQDWRRAPTDILFVDFVLWLWLWSIVTNAQQDRGKTLD